MSDIENILGAIGRQKPPANLQERILSACDSAEPVAQMSCDECVEHASAYLDDELDGGLRDAFEAHVFVCEDCFAAYRQMERTAEVLRSTPAASVPAGLQERIVAAVERDRAGSVFNWRRAAKIVGGLAAAAALLAAVFIPRGNDALDTGAPAVAELPSEVTAQPIEGQPSPEPMVADAPAEDDATASEDTDDAAPEPATTTPTRTRIASRARSSAPRGTSASRTPDRPRPTRVAAADSAPERAPAEAGDAGTAEPPAAAGTQPRPSARTAAEEPAERRDTRPETASEPVVAEERPEPRPVRERTPEVTPEPTAPEPAPRETAIAAMPSDPAPEPAAAGGPSAAPAATAQPPEPGAGRDSPRLAVVPKQPKSRTVYRPEPTSVAEREQDLTRLARNIDASQNPRMDNPPSGIELN
jgi:hypothetical protein